jgi:RNA polymerase sigma-70 factor, ECF subfamily
LPTTRLVQRKQRVLGTAWHQHLEEVEEEVLLSTDEDDAVVHSPAGVQGAIRSPTTRNQTLPSLALGGVAPRGQSSATPLEMRAERCLSPTLSAVKPGLTAGVAGLSFGDRRGMEEDERDERLVARARRGEASAVEALVRRYLRPAYAVALSVVLAPADAEDIAQESLVQSLWRLESCRHPERFGGWLLQAVRNRARNHLAWRRVRTSAAQASEAVAPSPDAAWLGRASLLQGLAMLTPAQREVVLLHDLEGWTHAEIAQHLGISETNSRQHLFQARRRLRQLLQDDAPRKAWHAT